MFRLSRVAWCFAALLQGAIAAPVSAEVLLAGIGAGDSAEAARAGAREDLALRLRRQAALQLEALSGDSAALLRQVLAGDRELPLLGVEWADAGAHRAEARLTDASLAAYAREAGRLRDALRAPLEIDLALARSDQLRRVQAVIGLFAPPIRPQAVPDETALFSQAARRLPVGGSPAQVARSVKSALDRGTVRTVRVVAPVRADGARVTVLAGSIADALRKELAAPAPGQPAPYTLDGRYAVMEDRVVLVLYLLDAFFATERAFAYVLPRALEDASNGGATAHGLSRALGRGLVRIDSLEEGVAAPSARPATVASIGVEVQAGRGQRGLYYHPGDRDQLLVKLDRPGYYYIVGHVDKAGARISYLMEIGSGTGPSRFVRAVGAAEANRWQTVGEFAVEPPLGEEAVQVIASSRRPPAQMLPATRYDSERQLHVIGTDPAEAIRYARGLVRIDMAETKTAPAASAEEPPAYGEAVLQFSTLP